MGPLCQNFKPKTDTHETNVLKPQRLSFTLQQAA